jgi:hypothetical protein
MLRLCRKIAATLEWILPVSATQTHNIVHQCQVMYCCCRCTTVREPDLLYVPYLLLVVFAATSQLLAVGHLHPSARPQRKYALLPLLHHNECVPCPDLLSAPFLLLSLSAVPLQVQQQQRLLCLHQLEMKMDSSRQSEYHIEQRCMSVHDSWYPGFVGSCTMFAGLLTPPAVSA